MCFKYIFKGKKYRTPSLAFVKDGDCPDEGFNT